MYQGLLHNLDVVFNMIQTLQYPTDFQDAVGNEIMRQNFNPTTETEQSRERKQKNLSSNFIKKKNKKKERKKKNDTKKFHKK